MKSLLEMLAQNPGLEAQLLKDMERKQTWKNNYQRKAAYNALMVKRAEEMGIEVTDAEIDAHLAAKR